MFAHASQSHAGKKRRNLLITGSSKSFVMFSAFFELQFEEHFSTAGSMFTVFSEWKHRVCAKQCRLYGIDSRNHRVLLYACCPLVLPQCFTVLQCAGAHHKNPKAPGLRQVPSN
jgi:hypothetical protein